MNVQSRARPIETTLLVYIPAALTGAFFVAFVAWLAWRAQAIDTESTLLVAVPGLVCVCAALGALVPDRGWRHGAVAGITAGLLTAIFLAIGGLRAAALVSGLPLFLALVAATAFASAVGAQVRRTLDAHRMRS